MDEPEQEERIVTYKLLDWARRVQALAQTGLAYTKDPYDIERYKSLRQIAAGLG